MVVKKLLAIVFMLAGFSAATSPLLSTQHTIHLDNAENFSDYQFFVFYMNLPSRDFGDVRIFNGTSVTIDLSAEGAREMIFAVPKKDLPANLSPEVYRPAYALRSYGIEISNNISEREAETHYNISIQQNMISLKKTALKHYLPYPIAPMRTEDIAFEWIINNWLVFPALGAGLFLGYITGRSRRL